MQDMKTEDHVTQKIILHVKMIMQLQEYFMYLCSPELV